VGEQCNNKEGSKTLGVLISNFAMDGTLLDSAGLDAEQAVAAILMACTIKVRIMDKVKHKDLEQFAELIF
jgi:hypothetical protein